MADIESSLLLLNRNQILKRLKKLSPNDVTKQVVKLLNEHAKAQLSGSGFASKKSLKELKMIRYALFTNQIVSDDKENLIGKVDRVIRLSSEDNSTQAINNSIMPNLDRIIGAIAVNNPIVALALGGASNMIRKRYDNKEAQNHEALNNLDLDDNKSPTEKKSKPKTSSSDKDVKFKDEMEDLSNQILKETDEEIKKILLVHKDLLEQLVANTSTDSPSNEVENNTKELVRIEKESQLTDKRNKKELIRKEKNQNFKMIEDSREENNTKGTPNKPSIFGGGKEGGLDLGILNFAGITTIFTGFIRAIKYILKMTGLLKVFAMFTNVVGVIINVGKLLLRLGPLALISAAVAAIYQFGKGFLDAADILGKSDVNVADRIAAGLIKISSTVAGFIGDAMDFVTGLFGLETSFGKKFADGTQELLSEKWNTLTEVIGEVSDSIVNMFKTVIADVELYIKNKITDIKSAVFGLKPQEQFVDEEVTQKHIIDTQTKISKLEEELVSKGGKVESTSFLDMFDSNKKERIKIQNKILNAKREISEHEETLKRRADKNNFVNPIKTEDGINLMPGVNPTTRFLMDSENVIKGRKNSSINKEDLTTLEGKNLHNTSTVLNNTLAKTRNELSEDTKVNAGNNVVATTNSITNNNSNTYSSAPINPNPNPFGKSDKIPF